MRVELVRPSRRHTADFLAAVRRSRRLHRSLVTPVRTEEEFHQILRRSRSPSKASFFVVHKDDRALVGVITISDIVRGFFQSAFLGYYAFVPYAGRGLMREGLTLALRHAFGKLKLHRLEANIQPSNGRSIALVQSLGFRLEGFSPKYLKISGQWRDHERYALLAPEWKKRKSSRES